MLWLGHSSLVCSSTYFHKIIRISRPKRSWIRSHRNTNNLLEHLRTNSEIAITKEITNCIFYLLFVKTYYIIFNIFYSTSHMTVNCNIFTFSCIKAKINQIIKYHHKFIMWQFSIQGRKIKALKQKLLSYVY